MTTPIRNKARQAHTPKASQSITKTSGDISDSLGELSEVKVSPNKEFQKNMLKAVC